MSFYEISGRNDGRYNLMRTIAGKLAQLPPVVWKPLQRLAFLLVQSNRG